MRNSILLVSKFLAVFVAFSILLSSCASSTMIISEPPGAKVYLNGETVGKTPYKMTDTKLVLSCTSVELKKEGYEVFYTDICKDEAANVGAIVGGLFLTIPFLWALKYKPTHKYELTPVSE